MIKNGLIIDGEVYDVYFVAGYPCSKCDLFNRCKDNMDRECPGQILGERRKERKRITPKQAREEKAKVKKRWL